MPEIDRDLESEMRARLGFKQLAAHAAAAELAPALDEESAAAVALNAWAAAGCKLDRRGEVLDEETTLRWEEQAAAAAAAAAYATTLEEHIMQRSERTAGCVRIWLRGLFAFSAVVLFMLALAAFVEGDSEVICGVLILCGSLICCCCLSGSRPHQLLCGGRSSSARIAPMEPAGV